MVDVSLTAGKDAWTTTATPNKANPQPHRPKVKSGVANTYVVFPGLRQQVLGKSIGLAVLSCGVRGTAAQTFTAAQVTAKWSPETVTANVAPTVGSTATSVEPALADGERLEIDVTTHVQAIAAGTVKDFGWRLSTNSAVLNELYGFASGSGSSWKLDVEFSDALQPPTPLSPLGGVVSKPPMLMWDWRDLDGEDTAQVSYRIQLGTMSGSVFTMTSDSGVIASSSPTHQLVTTPVVGSTTYWRVLVNDGSADSDWSDPMPFTYQPKPTLSITNPGTGVVWDSSPTFAFSLSSGTIKSYCYQVLGASGEVRYDSHRQPASSASVTSTMPAKSREGKRVLHEGRTYTLEVWAWDRNDRETAAGDPPYIKTSTTFVMDEDATPTAPSGLLVSQVGTGPWSEWQFQRASGVSTAFEFGIGDRLIDRVDVADLENVGTSWSWRTPVVPAYVTNLCWVRAIDNASGKRTKKSAEFAFTYELTGIWLADETDDTRKVELQGANVDGLKLTEKRATYSPINLPYDIDIVYAQGGVEGPLVGGWDSTRGRDWETDLATLKSMRSATEEPVRLAYGTVNVPVILRGVSPGMPSPDMLPSNMRHTVTLDVHQVDEFGDD